MTGHPLREWILFAVAWAILAIPVWKLTTGRPAAEHATTPTEPATAGSDRKVHAFATARISGSPDTFTVQQGDAVLWQAETPVAGRFEERILLGFDRGAVELSVRAHWPAGSGEQVFELLLAPDGFAEKSAHAWADAELDEVFIYDWPEMVGHE